MSTNYKLVYFNFRGEAEATRYLLSYLNIPFEDKRYGYGSEEWKKDKPTYPWGQLPVLMENDGEYVISQSYAILRYLGNKYNLLGANVREIGKCDEFVDAIKDLFLETFPLYEEKDDGKKKELREKLMKDFIPRYLTKFDAELKSNGGKFIVGKQITWADFALIHNFAELKVPMGNPDILNDYPTIKKYVEDFFKIPQIKSWVQNRPNSPF